MGQRHLPEGTRTDLCDDGVRLVLGTIFTLQQPDCELTAFRYLRWVTETGCLVGLASSTPYPREQRPLVEVRGRDSAAALFR